MCLGLVYVINGATLKGERRRILLALLAPGTETLGGVF
jgi:hypothetical protein